jgi:molybdate/tungstate transport system ATP-binding protein
LEKVSFDGRMISAKAKKKLGAFLLDAELQDEGFICLTGHNGSGKTTFLNIIAGALKGDYANVEIGKRNVSREPVERKEIVLVTPQSHIPHMKVEKHLLWGAKTKGVTPDQHMIEEITRALGINYSGNLRDLSLGMRERVALATALLSHPKLILVDEAFSNIDKRDEFITEFRRLCADRKIDVIFTTQDPNDGSLSDHLYEMSEGKSKRVF